MILYEVSLTCYLVVFATTLIKGNIEDNYIGCYYDDVEDYSQLQKTTLQNNTTLTIEWCIGQCLLRNSTYAGLENSKACLCGDDFGVGSPDTSCNSLCPGNKSEYCGGSNGERAFYSTYAVCELGYYGWMCDQMCHCRRQAPCNRMTGKCPNECEDKWSGTTCNEILLKEKYIGCFRDNEKRAISPDYFCNDRMTVEFCSYNCTLRNKSILGLQANCHCFCGEKYSKYGLLSDSSCSDPCRGNESQKCGGAWANSVYSVCPAGYYGPKCHNQCHCYNNSRCVYLTGECNSTCKAGWTGNSCNIRDCKTGNGDCSQNETCAAVNLNFATTIGCRCLPGFEKRAFWDICRDIDECKSNTSSCNPRLEYCVNNIGSYICECKNGFVHISGQCEDTDECRNDSLAGLCHVDTELCVNTYGSYACQCKSGYANTTFGNCTDVDECHLDGTSSPCNAFAEYCVNSIGSYACTCREDFTCGKYDGYFILLAENLSSTTGIILITLLSISVLINALLVLYLISSVKSRNAESSKGEAQSDFKLRCNEVSEQLENNYADVPEFNGEDNVYEQINLKKRQVVFNPTSEYAALKLDD